MRKLARVFTARSHRECVHMCAHLHAIMCTHYLCVRAVKPLASVRMCVHTCAHWPTQRMNLDEHS